MITPEVTQRLEALARQHNLTVQSIDENRPWGGEFIFAGDQVSLFDQAFFGKLTAKPALQKLAQPKFLVIAPHQRFSWQYHRYRGELWAVIEGPVGVEISAKDSEPAVKILQAGDSLQTHQGLRHRLVGQADWGVVAELWVQQDSAHPSTESDNIRLQDDYGRA